MILYEHKGIRVRASDQNLSYLELLASVKVTMMFPYEQDRVHILEEVFCKQDRP